MLNELTPTREQASALFDTGLGMALNLGTAIALLIVGYIAAGFVQRFVQRKLLALPHFDATMVPFLSSVARGAILTLTFILVLSEFGVQTASIIAVLGAAGLAVGLALQGTLSNVASGIMLLVLRPFHVGNYIEAAGTSGTVDEIGLFVTTLRTPQNIVRVVPNSAIFGGMIANYNARETMRVDLEVGISYDDKIDQAKSVLRDVVAAEPRFLAEPPAQVVTKTLADSSVNLEIRAWVKQADYFGVRFDLLTAIKDAFDAEGVSIPYPHRQVIMSETEGPPSKDKPRRTNPKRAA